ncbi:GNAT family N-acetyltransferase [Pseudomonas yamanorum]|jgi:predicted GNAT family N-acyltransferase|uniref:GNAT family N-acetyltransferase n=1 Tax=Pseudomonas yamanorum TaxID=515393 RepID=A0ABU1CNG6_9PSED|nr:GNAT family N-acetyltransferase [Pseudomonas yamanorum]MDR0188780.1 GNAT family N-acetyltransferase [Pseudomonas yamanorum]SDU02249.1 Acetyltransferase (GNAT) family protein [Pseudomonas yamanorum]
MDPTFKPVISSGVPESARQLFWEVFFSSRGRGIDLLTHFPWMSCVEKVSCVEIKDSSVSDETIAALVIRTLDVSKDVSVGLIGLVCVDEKSRGKGLASSLMSSAIKFGEHQNLAALILWTQKPEVYTGQGFITDERDRFGHIQLMQEQRSTLAYTTRDWPDSSYAGEAERGLPPFATGGQMISSENAGIIVLVAGGGLSIADWFGREKDVVDLIRASMSDRCSLNVGEEDSLISELEEQGLEFDLSPAAIRMVRYLGVAAPVELPKIKFLDRI